MSSTKWTKQQLLAIETTGQNTLVAAAAGSGKTAVLVERIIRKIIEKNIDIDKLLVVTFTSAAALEIRERILEAIYKKIDEVPDNENLQRQIILLNKANISTIHSFCLTVIRENFFEIGITPDFRVADTAEIELLKLEVIDELFENLYEEKNSEFLKLIEMYTDYRSDDSLKELILNIYKYIQSNPFPEKWLEEQVKKFDLKNSLENDFAKTEWGEILLKNFEEHTKQFIKELQIIKEDISKESELQKYSQVINDDISQLEEILLNLSSWDKTYEVVNSIKFKNWPADKKITSDLKELAKESRTEIKDNFQKLREKIFIYNSYEANQDLYAMYETMDNLKNLILLFTQNYTNAKQAKNIIDFNDIEHYALNILVQNYEPTNVAKRYMEKFEEIAIDEYQDSNLVQEYILSSISNQKNLFMVGDVKQSIYKFRQARPELFLEKYQNYKLEDDLTQEDSLKVQLFNNFRSRPNVLIFANTIFENIMSKSLGDIDYNKDEFLNYNANYQEPKQNMQTFEKLSLELIDVTNKDDEFDNAEIEAKYVAKRIKEILDSNYQVWDKKQGYRKATYKDVVVLLRSPGAVAPIYEREISLLDMPVFSDVSTKYLESIEIETIINTLKIVDNPLQDIALVTVLRSYIGGFTDNELTQIRLVDRNCYFYESLIKAKEETDEKLKIKIEKFLKVLEGWKIQQDYLPLNELIWKIFTDTGYFNYVSLMPNGILRQANLKLLFEQAKQYEQASFKGLFNFIKFIEKLKNNSNDIPAAKLIGENENVIRIMSIHKSKGLEFPIVFLSGTGKKVNLQDLNQNILIHQDLGFGPKYINYERKIEYNTLAKEAIRIKMKNDNLSEELRVLYVALTRSREQLIITGIVKDFEKTVLKKEKFLNVNSEKSKIESIILKKYLTYLDWMHLVCLKEQEKLSNILDVKCIQADEVYNVDEKIVENVDFLEKFKQYEFDINEQEKIERILNWNYEKIESTKIPSKSSVSNIKNTERIIKKVSVEKPNFVKNEAKLSKAEIGTVTHLIFQKIDFRKEYSLESLKKEIQKLVVNEIITEKEAKSINIKQIYEFVKSDFYTRIKNADKIVKEAPFYTYILANKIYNKDIYGKILVQGIVDLYFIEKGEIVLVDYKTDYVIEEKELVDKHKTQLKLYKEALEEATGLKVKETYIYSTVLNKAVNVIFL